MGQENSGYNLLKGLLIFLVIIGHLLYEPVSDNQVVYFLYTFHMPLFIGLTGHLLNLSFLSKATFGQLLKKYSFRVYFHWIIAWIVYYSIDLLLGIREFTLPSLITHFVFPIYHLWYIPAILFYIFLTWAFLKLKISITTGILLALIISIVFTQYWGISFGSEDNFWYNFYFKYKPHYFVFFLFGIWLKAGQEIGKKQIYIGSIVAALLMGWRWLQFDHGEPFFSLGYYVLNFLLIGTIIPLVSLLNRSILYPVEWIGQKSLYFYLWHVIFQYILFTKESIIYS